MWSTGVSDTVLTSKCIRKQTLQACRSAMVSFDPLDLIDALGVVWMTSTYVFQWVVSVYASACVFQALASGGLMHPFSGLIKAY